MNQIQATKKWVVQANTSSYGRPGLPGRIGLPEALSREFFPYQKKFKEPEVFYRGGAHLDTEISDFIKENIIRNYLNGVFQVQIIILGDYFIVLEKTRDLAASILQHQHAKYKCHIEL